MPSALVLDDSPVTAKLMARICDAAGFKAAIAFDAHQAMALLRANNIMFVLSDLDMVPVDGIEFARIIRRSAAFKATKIILTTRHLDRLTEIRKQNRSKALFDGFIEKPFTSRELHSCLSQIMTLPELLPV